MVMMPAMVMVMPAVMVMPRHDHVRHDDVVTVIASGMMVMPTMMVAMLDEHERVRIFRRDSLIDGAGA